MQGFTGVEMWSRATLGDSVSLIGPVRVSKKATDLAEVGWSVNIVLARLRGEWRIVELGFVYP